MGNNLSLDDRFGLRTPMQWSNDRNAGFSQADTEQLYLPVITDPVYGYMTVNVAAQRQTETSLFHRLQHLLAVRKHTPAFGRGSLEILYPENRTIFAYLRRYQGETILIINNLSCSRQIAVLDLQQFRGICPQDILGKRAFAAIREHAYTVDLEPHGFFWLQLTTGAPHDQKQFSCL